MESACHVWNMFMMLQRQVARKLKAIAVKQKMRLDVQTTKIVEMNNYCYETVSATVASWKELLQRRKYIAQSIIESNQC